MLDHMSSAGVMHRDGRRRGEEKVKHEKKKDVTAVHVRYRNTIPPLRWTVLGSVSPWSGPPCQTGHRPRCDRGVNSCPMNTSNEALRLPYPFPPLPVTTFPPFSFPHAYYGPPSRSPIRVPSSVSHVTFPFTVTLLSVITCQRGSSSSLSRTLTHYAYLLISGSWYDTSTRCGRPFPGLSCI